MSAAAELEEVVRASGLTAGEEAAEDASREMTEDPDSAVLPEERQKRWTAVGFQRMRYDWGREDHAVLLRIEAVVEGRVRALFPTAYEVMFAIYKTVRDPVTDPATGETTGEVDEHGWTVWEKIEGTNVYREDWSRLGTKQRERLLLTLSTHLFDWEQVAASQRSVGAMFAKAIWAEHLAYAHGQAKGTDKSRTEAAALASMEERYFALLQSAVSTRADALIRSMERLARILRDTLSA